MTQQKGSVNIKSLLSTIDKINTSYFQNNIKTRKRSKQKETNPNKIYTNDYSINLNIPKKENIYDFNNFFTNNNNTCNIAMSNKISLTKHNQNNFAQKRSLSKSIFNSINLMNNNYGNISLNKKSNISSGGGGPNKNNSHEKNTPPLVINKNKGIILNKVNLFKNVKFRKPSLNNMNNIHNFNNVDINSNNSNTNTVIQSLSSLNMTSTDITTSTKRKKDKNFFNIENKLFKENLTHNINNFNEKNIFSNNNTHFNQFNNSHVNNFINNNNRQNSNKPLYNLTNINLSNQNNQNTTYQYYKEILQNSNNVLNKIKKPNNNNNNNANNNKKINKKVQKKTLKDKRSTSQIFFGDICKKNTLNKKNKKNLTLNSLTNNNNATKTCCNNKSEGGGGTIISDDSVFNNSKRRSSSGTHNDSSKISKGSGTLSIDKKTKSISIDYTYSDDEIQTNRRKKMNKIQIEDDKNDFIKINKKELNNFEFKEDEKEKVNLIDNDININSLEFKNFCKDLSAKLFGSNI